MNAVFNVAGFAIYIKISGLILIKNYIHKRLNLRIALNEEFNMAGESQTYGPQTSTNMGYHGPGHASRDVIIEDKY